MSHQYFISPAVEAELAYRREILQNLERGTTTTRRPWRRSRQAR